MENFRNTTLKIIIRPLSQKRYFTESRRKLHGGKASVLPLKSIRKQTVENSPVNMHYPNGWYVGTAAVTIDG